jgi:murein DD-endopeptidase MepM/ murein hydrolase activator NlpD
VKIIFVSNHHGSTRQFTLAGWTRALLSICFLGLPLGAGIYIGQASNEVGSDGVLTKDASQAWAQILEEQQNDVERVKENSESQISAITLRMAELQGRLVRLDALGERLTSMAHLDNGEFNFDSLPAIGGPETAAIGDAHRPPQFIDIINQLADQISDREQQLDTLESLMTNRSVQADVFVAGRPVLKGWMSSRYGRRTDPFNGKVAWHSGVDFAGKLGSEIIAVASGVVVESGERNGYGGMVKINHGNGFQTRYAHTKKNLIKIGDVVKKGQVIALMGSTGRSTGPHVHFEVYKYGRPVDPASYINRTHR